ncbi:MAG: hypothetical protein ACLRPU_05035 [Enterococcus hulanensis]
MAAIAKETQDRLKYTDKFIANGGSLTELFKDSTFLDLIVREKNALVTSPEEFFREEGLMK